MARNSDVVLWGDGEGAYLSLSVRPGVSGTYGAPSGLGPMVRDSALPEDAGAAWLSEPDDPRGATMWWVQPSGDLWILRSEEHTSELQSLMRISYAVFCLKKKKQHTTQAHRLTRQLNKATHKTL